MAESSKGLPELSSAAWGALLASGLIALVLAVYPVVVYPALLKKLTVATSPLIGALRSPSLAFGFAGASAVLLVRAVTGQRDAATRNRMAYASVVVALVGLTALFVGIYGAAR